MTAALDRARCRCWCRMASWPRPRDPEVRERARWRTFAAKYKLAVLAVPAKRRQIPDVLRLPGWADFPQRYWSLEVTQ
jgi:hypothetical protein